MENVRLEVGQEIITLVKSGRENTLIGRFTDGRVILFSKESPLREKIKEGNTLKGKITHVSNTYILVEPEEVYEDSLEALKLNLKNVENSGYYQHAVLAKALLYLIERMEVKEC